MYRLASGNARFDPGSNSAFRMLVYVCKLQRQLLLTRLDAIDTTRKLQRHYCELT